MNRKSDAGIPLMFAPTGQTLTTTTKRGTLISARQALEDSRFTCFHFNFVDGSQIGLTLDEATLRKLLALHEELRLKQP